MLQRDVELSILYLRCTATGSIEVVAVVKYLSILYLRCTDEEKLYLKLWLTTFQFSI